MRESSIRRYDEPRYVQVFLLIIDVVRDAEQVNLVFDIIDEAHDVASSLRLNNRFTPHCYDMAHSLLVEQELEDRCIFNAIITT